MAIEKRYNRPIMSSFHALFSIGGLSGAITGAWLATLGMRPETHFCLMAEDGKIKERWANVDELGLLRQIGAAPAPPPPNR
jgi:hypothetical protein